MPKKKTNYDNRGFARKLAGRIFSSRSSSTSQSQWRPRKTKFERLDLDDAFDPEAITNAFSFSVESETGDYKRDLMAKKKKKATQKVKKRDFAGIAIQPSARDKHTGSAKKKKQRTDALGFPISSGLSVDYSIDSRQTASSKQTTSHHSVMSDPTNFFSKKPATLTKGNLEMLASGSAGISQSFSGDGIENNNPRSKFYQFTIDEDKESTVILPVGYPAEEEFDDDINSAQDNSFKEEESLNVDAFGLPKEFGNRSSGRRVNTEVSSARQMSVASLCYSPSPKEKRAKASADSSDGMWQPPVFHTPPPKKNEGNFIRAQTQPRPIRDGRLPLSPLNGMRTPSSTSKIPSLRKNDEFSGMGSWSDFVNGSPSSDHFGRSDKNDDIFQDNFHTHKSQSNERAPWGASRASNKHSPAQLYGFSKENKPLESFDSADSSDAFRPRIDDEQPIGIQSFVGASRGSSGRSTGSGTNGKLLYTHGRPVIAASRSFDDDYSISNSVSKTSSVGSVAKPMGLPSNAIVASMLFQRHHNVDTRAVEKKLKVKREENSKIEAIRGDVPRAIQAQDDMYSCISSFSDDTGIEPWKKPTRDLLHHFANSRRTEFDTGRYRREQRAQTTPLFEA